MLSHNLDVLQLSTRQEAIELKIFASSWLILPLIVKKNKPLSKDNPA